MSRRSHFKHKAEAIQVRESSYQVSVFVASLVFDCFSVVGKIVHTPKRSDSGQGVILPSLSVCSEFGF